jgi:hypothetical protein
LRPRKSALNEQFQESRVTLLLGTWVGLKLFGRLDEAGYRKIVLVLLLASGVTLLF